jgi:hypothetical protein
MAIERRSLNDQSNVAKTVKPQKTSASADGVLTLRSPLWNRPLADPSKSVIEKRSTTVILMSIPVSMILILALVA